MFKFSKKLPNIKLEAHILWHRVHERRVSVDTKTIRKHHSKLMITGCLLNTYRISRLSTFRHDDKIHPISVGSWMIVEPPLNFCCSRVHTDQVSYHLLGSQLWQILNTPKNQQYINIIELLILNFI